MRRRWAPWVAAALLVASHGARADETTIKALYNRCEGCHATDRNKQGPMLDGLFGRSAGGVAGYEYSAALSGLTLHWDDQTLGRFLADPQGFAPGNKMEFRGIDNAAERRELIEYLHRVLKR